MRRFTKFAILASAAFGLSSGPVAAAPEGEVSYVISRGDTLYKLTEDYLLNPRATARVRQINRIRNPRRLQIGQVIRIPREILRYEPVDLSIQALSGQVSVRVGGRARTPEVGLKVAEGTEISTGANGFISIAGTRSSRVTIPTNSRVRIIDARRYLINDAIDIQFKILGGRGEVVAPKLNKDEKFRIGTPSAVTAVRGTQFRVAFDEAEGRSLTEVVEGEVSVTASEVSKIAGESFGVAVMGQEPSDPEPLLAPPALIEPGKIQTKASIDFAIEPMSDAVGYRTQISKDAGFVELIEETVQDAPAAQFSELADGRYFVRSRGIAQSGLEGTSEVHSFRRKRIGAAAGADPFGDAFKFAWRKEGEGNSYNAFQLWDEKEPGKLLVDEVAMEETAIYISNLGPGKYRWRVATFLVEENEIIKVWAPTQEISVSE
ncbi:MAG: FecR domain-containing protein [Pseudomonadota bacterium]